MLIKVYFKPEKKNTTFRILKYLGFNFIYVTNQKWFYMHKITTYSTAMSQHISLRVSEVNLWNRSWTRIWGIKLGMFWHIILTTTVVLKTFLTAAFYKQYKAH